MRIMAVKLPKVVSAVVRGILRVFGKHESA